MKYLIFDFDGTIVDNLPYVFTLFQKNMLQKGIDLSQYPIEELRQIGIKNFVKQVKVSKLELLIIYKNIKKEIRQHLEEYPPVKELATTLEKLSKDNKLYVLSSNKKENINSYLKKYKLDIYFQDIFEDNSYFGKHVGIKDIIKKLEIKANDVFYFGDETRDIVAAKKAEVKSVAVTWGFEGDKALSKLKPDYLLSNPKDILKIIK